MDILIVLRTRYSSTVVILYIALCCHFNHMSISFANPIEILYWNVSNKRYHTGGVSHHCRTFGMVFIIKNRQILGCHHRHRLLIFQRLSWFINYSIAANVGTQWIRLILSTKEIGNNGTLCRKGIFVFQCWNYWKLLRRGMALISSVVFRVLIHFTPLGTDFSRR